MIWLLKLWGRVTGKNAKSLPVAEIVSQMNGPRPLPIGRPAFETWSDRIIAGACLKPGPDDGDEALFNISQKWALATMIMHLGPTESHKPDAFFIHQMRKAASNQTAHGFIQEVKEARDRQIAAEKEKLKIVPKEQSDTTISGGQLPQ